MSGFRKSDLKKLHIIVSIRIKDFEYIIDNNGKQPLRGTLDAEAVFPTDNGRTYLTMLMAEGKCDQSAC